MTWMLASGDLQVHVCDLEEQQAGTFGCNLMGVRPCHVHQGLQGAAWTHVVLEHLHLPWKGGA